MTDRLLNSAKSFSLEAQKLSAKLGKEITDLSNQSIQAHFYDTAEDKLPDIPLISKGKDLVGFFPDVVKNVASTSFTVRKLVYIYLLCYAERQPDLALLSINTFQKDLHDKNPMIRAMALRVLSSIKVPVILPLIIIALKGCIRDMSPYVRKAASNAITKCYGFDPSQRESFVEMIELLLNDKSTIVLGSVVSCMDQICPERLDLLHPHFRKLCKLIVETDEWGQLKILNLLLRYCRTFFRQSDVSMDPPYNDSDLNLFIESCDVLMSSRNPAVVLGVSQVYFYVFGFNKSPRPARSLIRILNTTYNEEKYVVLLNILTIAKKYPENFSSCFNFFFLLSGELKYIWELKLDILSVIVNESNIQSIFMELSQYARYTDQQIVVESIKGIGKICAKVHSIIDEALSLLMTKSSSHDENVSAEAVVVIRSLLQMKSSNSSRIVMLLASSLDTVTIGKARASILFLISQYCDNAAMMKIALDTLRENAKLFVSSVDIVKLQILTLAAKLTYFLISYHTKEIKLIVDYSDEFWKRDFDICLLLFQYILELAKFDLNYDIRDRSKLLKAMIYNRAVNFQIKLNNEEKLDDFSTVQIDQVFTQMGEIVIGEKLQTVSESIISGRDMFFIGSLSHTLVHPLAGYSPIPEWSTTRSDPTLRNPKDEVRWDKDSVIISAPIVEISRMQNGGGGSKTKKRVVKLNDFYRKDETSSEEDDDDGGDSEEDDSDGD